MDFSKAFDKVCYHHLIKKLTKYGITGNINERIASFLADRDKRLMVKGVASE